MRRTQDLLTIGEIAERSGFATSAIRFYEDQGLVRSQRTAGNHRQFPRYTLRRLAFIRSAQRVGLSLDEIAAALATLPIDRAPTKGAWARLSSTWRTRLDERIADLEHLRDDLTSCIGCGCLSLASCRLSNPQDAVAVRGDGPRYLLGDDPDDFAAGVAPPALESAAAAE
jgi:MerR family transcriptional regulator, redox-sensitive transcriptional activator SoxR